MRTLNKTLLVIAGVVAAGVAWHVTFNKPDLVVGETAPIEKHHGSPQVPHAEGATPKLLERFVPKEQASIYKAKVANAEPADKDPARTIAATMSAAEGGAPDAMHALANALELCATADMGTDEEIESRAVKQSIAMDALYRKVGDSTNRGDPAEIAAREAQRAKEIRNSCSKIPIEQSKTWLSWLERAAAAGDNSARLQYARDALNVHGDNGATPDPAEYVQRRDLAYSFLQDAISTGDCRDEVLNSLQAVSPDPTSSYIYGAILLRRGEAVTSNKNQSIEAQKLERDAIESSLNSLAAAVPEVQREAANNTIAYIQTNYCFD